MAMRNPAMAACMLAFALGGTAPAETADAVATRVRGWVEAQWSALPKSKPETEQRIGFTGRFTPRGGAEIKIRCDSGAVGVVTYTRFDGGGGDFLALTCSAEAASYVGSRKSGVPRSQ